MIIAGTADYLTPEKSLAECISEEEKWPVCATSIIQKLQILEQFLKAWEENAAAFLAQPQIGNIEATVASTSESVNHIALLKGGNGALFGHEGCARAIERDEFKASRGRLEALYRAFSTGDSLYSFRGDK